MIIVLTGIDGSGKSTAARALVAAVRAGGGRAMLVSNHAGRRVMSLAAAKLGVRLPDQLVDAVETVLRVGNVLLSHLRASRFDGLVVMDRHLHCQLALRRAKGLPRGRFLPWLLARLPQPNAILHLDLDHAEAHRRITARGTDSETLDDLAAFRSGYRELPEFAGFVQIDASRTADEVAADLDARLVFLRLFGRWPA
ncbi:MULTISPECIES: AAA family ATPase [unclassified Arthrobacter]|uniref:AAA family ATPase n=1 Tax=unclassified Arthrobacter TaxID=235627 RepID=UPI001F39D7DB|nr:AAA family ATPase [Arthrobacter sp. FW306-06-A]UKA70685.1 AAA family ATPase [Arthrobacter sp. FW306-06-A]